MISAWGTPEGNRGLVCAEGVDSAMEDRTTGNAAVANEYIKFWGARGFKNDGGAAISRCTGGT